MKTFKILFFYFNLSVSIELQAFHDLFNFLFMPNKILFCLFDFVCYNFYSFLSNLLYCSLFFWLSLVLIVIYSYLFLLFVLISSFRIFFKLRNLIYLSIARDRIKLFSRLYSFISLCGNKEKKERKKQQEDVYVSSNSNNNNK